LGHKIEYEKFLADWAGIELEPFAQVTKIRNVFAQLVEWSEHRPQKHI
jgi:hypothetical protein